MRTFHLYRKEDSTGISGIGNVAEGVVLHDGQVVLAWYHREVKDFGNGHSGLDAVGITSIAHYRSLDEVERIHGHGGATVVVAEERFCMMCGGQFFDDCRVHCFSCGAGYYLPPGYKSLAEEERDAAYTTIHELQQEVKRLRGTEEAP
jgi:hypothetical protein